MTTTLDIRPTEIATKGWIDVRNRVEQKQENTSSTLTKSVVQCNRVFREETMCVSKTRDMF